MHFARNVCTKCFFKECVKKWDGHHNNCAFIRQAQTHTSLLYSGLHLEKVSKGGEGGNFPRGKDIWIKSCFSSWVGFHLQEATYPKGSLSSTPRESPEGTVPVDLTLLTSTLARAFLFRWGCCFEGEHIRFCRDTPSFSGFCWRGRRKGT